VQGRNGPNDEKKDGYREQRMRGKAMVIGGFTGMTAGGGLEVV